MREFKRLDAPPAWVENEARWNEQWLALARSKPGAAFAWYSYNGQTARDIALPHLKAQTFAHCSFCDGFPVEGVSAETIEHFRPKCADGFPQYAYSWSNLYYCCSQCQLEKREGWNDALTAPDANGYHFLRYFEFDFTTGAIKPSTTATEDDNLRASVTISAYGLDTPSRRRRRREALKGWTDTKAEARNINLFGYRDYIEFAMLGPAALQAAQDEGQR